MDIETEKRHLLIQLNEKKKLLLHYRKKNSELLETSKHFTQERTKEIVVIKQGDTIKPQSLIKQSFGIDSDSEDDGDDERTKVKQPVVKEIIRQVSYTDNLKQKMIKNEEELKNIEKEIREVESGQKDELILKNMKLKKKQEEDRLQKDNTRKINMIKEKEEKQKFQDKMRKKENTERNDEFILRKEEGRGYHYFMNVCNEIDSGLTKNGKDISWIRKELEKLPNNRGIIYGGIHFYGHQKPDKNNRERILEERFKGYKFMHIWNDICYRVVKRTYSQQGQPNIPDELIKKQMLRKKLFT